ncbi:MAG TPA: hypothetical protein VFT04_00220, partial [Gemmatimonadales bacterium]|nr:hypothetical protein [Gemmatimonadales bacterium]
MFRFRVLLACLVVLSACSPDGDDDDAVSPAGPDLSAKVAQYTSVRLDPDLSSLTDAERRMIPLLIDAADAMNQIYWAEAYGNRDSLLAAVTDPA